jgi:hypothetical protein
MTAFPAEPLVTRSIFLVPLVDREAKFFKKRLPIVVVIAVLIMFVRVQMPRTVLSMLGTIPSGTPFRRTIF